MGQKPAFLLSGGEIGGMNGIKPPIISLVGRVQKVQKSSIEQPPEMIGSEQGRRQG
jgi:hypothetical protein